jgi:hypothetical protein
MNAGSAKASVGANNRPITLDRSTSKPSDAWPMRRMPSVCSRAKFGSELICHSSVLAGISGGNKEAAVVRLREE